MMTGPPPTAYGADDSCPICHKPKSKHNPEEILKCSREMKEIDDARKED